MEGVQSTIEDINEVTKEVKVTVPADRVEKDYREALGEFAKGANLKGFRSGKAPVAMIEKMHGQRVQLEVANRLISESLQGILKDIEGDVIGSPEIELSTFEKGKDLEFVAKVSLYPKPEIEEYKGIKVEVAKRDVTDKDIDETIDRIRGSRATHNKIEDREEVQKGDVIDAKLSSVTPDGKEEPAEPLVIEVGVGQLPEPLDEGIVGMKIGESKEIVYLVPEEYPVEDMRGKDVTYTVALEGISEKVLPEMDDAFAESLNFDGVKTLPEMKLKVREQLESERSRQEKEEVQEAVMEDLSSRHDFVVPEILVEDEIRNLVVRNGMVDTSKLSESDFSVDEFREQFEETAIKRVRLSIIVDRVAEKEELKAEKADIDAHITQVSEQNGIPRENVEQFFMDRQRLLQTALEVTRNKVLDFLQEQADISRVEKEG